MKATVIYSWIMPIYNEAESIIQLTNEIKKAMAGRVFEIIAINDGSTDTSRRTLHNIQASTPQLRIISFSTRQGKWSALSAGITAAKGSIIITIDSDLQDDPKEVTKLLKLFNQGYDIISGQRTVRYDPWYKVFLSRLGNGMLSCMTRHNYHDMNASFKVYRRDVLADIPKEGAMLRFSLLFGNRLGYKTKEIPITHRPRIYGVSKFGVVKYARILVDLFLILLLFSGSGRIKAVKPK